jgi:hypothetical protein
MKRERQRGSAMLVTMIVIAALLAGAAVLASMQMSSNRSTELTRNGLASLYCAEAGLAAAREYIGSNYGQWNPALAANCADGDCKSVVQPSWLDNTIFSHDLDNPADSVDDFMVSLRDNDDEIGAQNGSVDADDKVYIVSRCLKYPDTPKTVEELIEYKPAMNCYKMGKGGCNSQGNSNNEQ